MKTYSQIATREDIQDFVPSVKRVELHGGEYTVYLRNGKTKLLKGKKRLYFYLGWLLSHDSLIK